MAIASGPPGCSLPHVCSTQVNGTAALAGGAGGETSYGESRIQPRTSPAPCVPATGPSAAPPRSQERSNLFISRPTSPSGQGAGRGAGRGRAEAGCAANWMQRRPGAAAMGAVPVTGRAFRVRACCHMCLRPCCRTHLLAPAGARIDEAVCVSLTSSCARVPLSVRAERILPCAPACAAHSPPHTVALQMRLKPPQRAPHSVVLWRTLSRRVLWAHVPRRGAIVRLSLGVLSLWSAAYMSCPIGDLWGRLWFIVMHFIFRFRKRKSENSPMCGLISHKT